MIFAGRCEQEHRRATLKRAERKHRTQRNKGGEKIKSKKKACDCHYLLKQPSVNWCRRRKILQGYKCGGMRRGTHELLNLFGAYLKKKKGCWHIVQQFIPDLKGIYINIMRIVTPLDCSFRGTCTNLCSQFLINYLFSVRILQKALQYSLKVPWCLWATAKVITITAGYSFLLHKASYLCKCCWAVDLSLPCSRSPLI